MTAWPELAKHIKAKFPEKREAEWGVDSQFELKSPETYVCQFMS